MSDSDSVVGAAIVGGIFRTETRLYRATAGNVFKEDITSRIENGSIDINKNNENATMTMSGEINNHGYIEYYRDWIAPVTTITIPDPDGQGDFTYSGQLGLYMYLPPSRKYTSNSQLEQIDARDALWKMATSGPGYAYSITTGANVVTRMRLICDNLGLRHGIQASTDIQPNKRTWQWDATWIQIFNELGMSIGYVKASTDRTGRVRTGPFKKLGEVKAARRITDAQVYDTIQFDHDLSRLCNHVIVVGNNPKTDAVYKKSIVNDDPTSESSTARLGVRISRFEEDPNLTTQSAVDARAEHLMDQGSSVIEHMQVTSVPFVDWNINDTIDFDISNYYEQVADGTWRWETLSMNLQTDPVCVWGAYKVVRWAQVTP